MAFLKALILVSRKSLLNILEGIVNLPTQVGNCDNSDNDNQRQHDSIFSSRRPLFTYYQFPHFRPEFVHLRASLSWCLFPENPL